MTDFNAFVSPEYPVLFTTLRGDEAEEPIPEGFASLSLGLLVKGIPSFLATIPVADEDLDTVEESLGSGNVRVAVVGISVDGTEVEAAGEPLEEPPEEWGTGWSEESGSAESFPAAFLSLVCADGRRIGVARIVARAGSASPEDVARFVLKQIAQGVQIPDLASTP